MTQPNDLPIRVALVTGASSGIGEAVATELARRGWRVGLTARRGDRLQALALQLRSSGATVAIAAADAGDRQATQVALAALREELGPVDLLIANAGLGEPDQLNPLSVDMIERMIRVNLLGPIYAIETLLPEMIARNSGHIAVVSSMAAFRGLPGSGGYCASKAGITRFMESLRVHLREHNITTTTIHPGFVRTPMTDVNKFQMPFLQEPEVAARRIVNAIERRVKVYNFPKRLSFLMKLLTWMPDWFLAKTLPRKSDQ